jgi:subtilisin family serine protease
MCLSRADCMNVVCIAKVCTYQFAHIWLAHIYTTQAGTAAGSRFGVAPGRGWKEKAQESSLLLTNAQCMNMRILTLSLSLNSCTFLYKHENMHYYCIGANLIAVKVLGGTDGSGSTSSVIAGIDWVVKKHTDSGGSGLSVANLSLGGAFSSSFNQVRKANVYLRFISVRLLA